jgi:hypothetical protein
VSFIVAYSAYVLWITFVAAREIRRAAAISVAPRDIHRATADRPAPPSAITLIAPRTTRVCSAVFPDIAKARVA